MKALSEDHPVAIIVARMAGLLLVLIGIAYILLRAVKCPVCGGRHELSSVNAPSRNDGIRSIYYLADVYHRGHGEQHPPQPDESAPVGMAGDRRAGCGLGMAGLPAVESEPDCPCPPDQSSRS